MKLIISDIKQKKILFSVIGVIILIIIFVLLYKNNNKNNTGELIKEEKKISIKKNVSAIAKHVFFEYPIQYTAQIKQRDIQNMQKKCIVIEIKYIEQWNEIDKHKQTEIIQGLINTSRLQLDKSFGCVTIEYMDTRIVEGFWQNNKGYVIINK